MVCCGWALQALNAYPDMWKEGASRAGSAKPGLVGPDTKPVTQEQVVRWLERELGSGLRTWESIFAAYGYIPTGIGCQTILAGTKWDAFSDTGGYAHLISAAAQWILFLDGKRDWDVHRLPRASE